MEQKQYRSSFSGKRGFVLSAAGASVGLGNIWRFPYLAAKYGGGIFLLIYIVLALTFGYTMIMAETALGRMTHKSPVSAYGTFAKPGKKNGFLGFGGWINAIIPVLIVPYYSVIGGWVIKYLAEYLMGKAHLVAEDGYFSSFISNGVSSELCFLVFTAMTLAIIFAGVENGIERVSKIMMPILVVLFALILVQEGVGTLDFGTSVLWYLLVITLFFAGRWMFETENWLFVLLLSGCIGLAHYGVIWLMTRLQFIPLDMTRLLDESILQALLTPFVWQCSMMARRWVVPNENNTA